MSNRLPIPPEDRECFCEKYSVSKLSLFGSVLNGTDSDNSDIDLPVEFIEGAKPTFPDLAEMEQELSTLLGSRIPDLRTPRGLSRYFRDDVLRTAEVQYVAG